MGTEKTMIVISACVLVSYWFSHLARVLRVPSVVLLLAAGLLLREFTDHRQTTQILPADLLPVLGTIGLILIVLEGGLDLNLRPGRRRFLLSTFGAAAFGVVLCSAALAVGLHLALGVAWPQAALLAVPFAVISSAVAIPSAEVLSDEMREYVIYESSWSDIVGVMLFNAVLLALAAGSGEAALSFFGGGLAVLVLGVAIGIAVFWLVGHLEGHVKFLPLIFALILVYAGAKALHLSPLLIVLILGLMLNNPHLLLRVKWFEPLYSKDYWSELGKLKHLTAEATFFVRTFFFVLLGYSTDLQALADLKTWAVAVGIVAAIFLLRLPVVWLLGDGRGVRPLLWAAPRGLITVLLFFSLPAAMVPEVFPPDALILVVLLSCTIMALGFRFDGAPAPKVEDTVERRVEAAAAPPP
jgi:NhaP-type Na+/H+ or K+/H+ antiporter